MSHYYIKEMEIITTQLNIDGEDKSVQPEKKSMQNKEKSMQLQPKADEEWEEVFDYKLKDLEFHDDEMQIEETICHTNWDRVKQFIRQQIDLAFERGRKEVIDMMLELEVQVKEMKDNDFDKKPYCLICKKPMNKESDYIWKFDCECSNKDMRLSIG